MKKLLIVLTCLLSLNLAQVNAQIFAPGGGSGSVTVQETDGAPNVSNVTNIKLSNGSLTDNGGGSVTIATSGATNETIGASTVTGGTNGSFLIVGAGPLLQQANITGLVLGNGASAPTVYGGCTGTNQVLRVLAGTGACTFVTLTSAYVDTSIWTGSVASGLLKASSQGIVAQATVDVDYMSKATGMEEPAGNGLVARTAANTAANRTITGTANAITITNGDGVAGNPVVNLDTIVDASAKTFRIPNGASLPGTCAVGDFFASNSATTGKRIFYCETTNNFVLEGDGGGVGNIGGSTGATDQAILRANGTGGATLQSSLATVDNTGLGTFPGGVTIATSGVGVLTLLEGAAPGAPASAGQHNLYMDSSDSKFKSQKNGGSVITYVRTADNLAALAATTSVQLAGVLSDETGSGAAVFATTPTITTPVISGAISFPAGVRQTFAPNATTPGLNWGSVAGDPSTPNNGDSWYDSTGNHFRCRENGANVNCVTTGAGTGTVTNVNPGTNTGISTTNPGGPVVTVDWLPSGYAGNVTLWNNVNATRTLTADLTGTDPVITFGSSSIDVTTGTLKQGGVSVTTASTTDTFTNKSTDCEGTGNVCSQPKRIWIPVAGCNNATAGSVVDLPISNAAVPACVTGTNTQKGVLDFADNSNLSFQYTYKLPSTWTGTLDANFKWFTADTSAANMVWQIATICVGDGSTDDPAFNASSKVTDAGKGTTNQTNDASITGVTITGCTAGQLMHIKVFRDAADAADVLSATARLIGVELVVREAI